MKIKNLLNKTEWNEIDYINFILEAVSSSARFGIVKEKEDDKYFVTRANLHGMLIMPFGSGKTTSFINIENSEYAYDITFPGLIGTITKDGEVVESSIMKAGGKILIIDEFQRLTKDVKNALNSILEYPHKYSRTLGFKIKSNVNKKTKFFYIKAKQNTNKFDVYSKFSCIASGMYVSKKTTIDKAWFSRFVPIRFNPTLEWYKKLSRGEVVIKINPHLNENDFVFKDYIKFNGIFWNKVENSSYINYFKYNENERGYLIRLLQDFVRFGCFFASLENRVNVRVEDCEFALNKLFDFILLSYITTGLDEIDLYILNNITNLSQAEISEKYKVSKSYISQKIRKLARYGIIKCE